MSGLTHNVSAQANELLDHIYEYGTNSEGVISRINSLCDAAVEQLRTELVAGREREARMQWQPIETAPKDGSYLLVSNGHGVWVARFKSVYQSGWKPPSPWQSMMLNHAHIPSAKRNGSPTHWMPLPTPPIAALAEGAQEPVHRPVHQPVHGALNNEA